MDNFKSFVEKVKDATDIVKVIGEDYRMDGKVVAGWQYATHPDSLAANREMGLYTWFANSPVQGQKSSDSWEQGDVFVYLQAHRNMDFWTALEYLAGQAGIQMPKFDRAVSEAEQKKVEQRESLLDLATGWFARQLQSTAAALQYARGRGWSEETIQVRTTREDGTVAWGAALGYSGGSAAAGDELKRYLEAAGCDVTRPEAVALVGLRGGILPWCQRWGIEAEKKWLEHDRIYGITDFPRLVYPLRKHGTGKTLYHHCRNLAWDPSTSSGTATLRGVRDGEEAPKMHNPPAKLMGDRPLFLNHCFSRSAAQIVIVEGPADAVSLGQWKVAAIALNGLGASEQLRGLLVNEKTNAINEGRVFLALDNDERGRAATEKVADLLGGMVKLVTWRHQ
jgi:hypothetical protein